MTILCTQAGPAAAFGLDLRTAADLSTVDSMLAHDPGEQLVVVGPDVSLAAAAEFAAAQRIARPTLGVVLVRHTPGIEDLTVAIRAGIREVVAAADTAGLADACDRSRALSAAGQVSAQAPAGKVVTVFATKGGCGKTTLATNLAAALAGPHRVCLVDLDLAFGDVAISMQLAPRRSLVDAVAMGDGMDETGIAGLLTPSGRGFDCVLAPVEPGDAERVPATLVEDLLRMLRGMFDYVVVDTPPQFNEHVLKALDAADLHVLPTTPDVPTLKNLRLTLEMLDLLGYPREARALVLNREDPRVGMTAADVERAISTPLAARIPASLEVTASINRGVPITLEQPGHKVSVAIRELAERRVVGVAAGQPPAKRRSRRPWTRSRRATQ
jgi:pilus assembly protein CpaE